jgi:Icc-related predicted phosphoesterase
LRFIYFTDIHLDTGTDSLKGFESCLEAMMAHEPELLINGGDLGITTTALEQYAEVMSDVTVPVLLSHGNHEMCSGYLPREQAGTVHGSLDAGEVHFVVLDVVRYFEPTAEHEANWHVLADESLLEWLAEDLSRIDSTTPVVLACHVPLSTTFPQRMGQPADMRFPTNEIVGARQVLAQLERFEQVISLHGHDHENCRHHVGHIEIMTTAAVAGNWWRNGLDSRGPSGREPQGYRVVDVGESIRSCYRSFVSPDQEVELVRSSDRCFVNVFDGSPRTRVEVEGEAVAQIDPLSVSSRGLATHLWELPAGFDRDHVEVAVTFEDGRTCEGVLELEQIEQ